MKRKDTVVTVMSLVAATWLGSAAVRAADQGSLGSASHPGSEAEMARFFTGSEPYRVDVFSGKLVCMRCDLSHAPDSVAQCRKNGHQHVLSMKDGSMIHPLLATSPEMLERMNSAELHGKNVKVQGRYYPSTGWILVNAITPDD